ncbi:GNAT family N-acetyltransferase [Candidatus Parvarchaeota archaeon]|nr:GNAT family N-acetyltransferase [Candidatus Parvarchaeota archaeon]
MEFKIKERIAFNIKLEKDKNKRKDIIKFLRAWIKVDPVENNESKFEYLKFYNNKKIFDSSYLFISANSDDGKIVGACALELYKKNLLKIDWLVVNKEHRRQGVGFSIIRYIIDYAKRYNLYNIECISLISNKESKKFLKKVGFKKVGKLKHYWAKQDYYLWEYLP